MENLENNKLIAEFMGWTLDDKDLNSYRKLNNNVFKYSLLSNFKYHTDWNWLMEVVDKIEGLGFSIEMNKQEETDYQCLITKGYDIIFQTFSNIKIEAVYNACIEFIKWYNKKK
jgi:hypothetical protein